jgi:hypothetical protein
MQREYEMEYKAGIKEHFKVHGYQKFLTLSGFAAATLSTIGFHNELINGIGTLGVAAGGLAMSQIINAKESLAKSAFLVLGGAGLGMVANFLPFSTLLHQATLSIVAAGLIGGVQNVIQTYKKNKM